MTDPDRLKDSLQVRRIGEKSEERYPTTPFFRFFRHCFALADYLFELVDGLGRTAC